MQNDMRDRLVTIIMVAEDECKYTHDCKLCAGYGKGALCMCYHIADILIKRGMILPPCKVGNTVYWIENNEIRVGEVTEIERRKEPEAVLQNAPIKETYNVCSALMLNGWELTPYSYSDFGKTVFLTKDQAEQKLKKMRGENDL